LLVRVLDRLEERKAESPEQIRQQQHDQSLPVFGAGNCHERESVAPKGVPPSEKPEEKATGQRKTAADCSAAVESFDLALG
jgi:hypothetical protein